jgi:hypothetical protein
MNSFKKLTEEDIVALKDAILRYNEAAKAVDPHDVAIGFHSCRLCGLYHFYHTNREREWSCEGCPVFTRTGHRFCRATPYAPDPDDRYNELDREAEKWKDKRLGRQEIADFRRRCRAEAEFLQSLIDNDPGKLKARRRSKKKISVP